VRSQLYWGVLSVGVVLIAYWVKSRREPADRASREDTRFARTPEREEASI
jgi:hypothetical protein